MSSAGQFWFVFLVVCEGNILLEFGDDGFGLLLYSNDAGTTAFDVTQLDLREVSQRFTSSGTRASLCYFLSTHVGQMLLNLYWYDTSIFEQCKHILSKQSDLVWIVHTLGIVIVLSGVVGIHHIDGVGAELWWLLTADSSRLSCRCWFVVENFGAKRVQCS